MRQSWGVEGSRPHRFSAVGCGGVAGGRGWVVKHYYIAVNRKFVGIKVNFGVSNFKNGHLEICA